MSPWTRRKAIEIGQEGLDILRRPGVYMYVQDDKAIYVGSARKLGERAIGKGHHKATDITKAQSLIMFPCRNYQEAYDLEQRLINDLSPRLNNRNPLQIDRLKELLGTSPSTARRITKICLAQSA
jgi:hypothetical protein